MCLTAKPTWEWTVSIVQFPVPTFSATGALIVLSPFVIGLRTAVRFSGGERSTQSDRGPLSSFWDKIEGDARPSRDPAPDQRTRRRRPQPRADPLRGAPPVRREGRELRLDGRDRGGSRRRQGHALPALRIARGARDGGAQRGRVAAAGSLHPRRAAARPGSTGARAPDRVRRGPPRPDRRPRRAALRGRSRERPPRLAPPHGQPPARDAAPARDRSGLRPRAAGRDASGRTDG